MINNMFAREEDVYSLLNNHYMLKLLLIHAICCFFFSKQAKLLPAVFALQNLYTSLNSARQLTGWSFNGTDPCGDSWEGIQCSKQAITEIHLPGLRLTGGLGYRLDQLTSLIILDLSNNQISGSLPYQLPANLQQLNLGSNNFSGSYGNFPYSFTGMTGLTYLNMSNNQLSGSISDVFWHLKRLNTLDLSFNKLAGELPQSFSNLSKLSAMHLQNNVLSGNLNVLANLPLQDLDVENNHFTGWIPSTFSSIANLKVNGNNFSIFPAPPPPPFVPPPPQQSQNQAASGPSAGNFDQQSTAANSSLGSSDKGSGLSSGAVAGIAVAGVLAVSIVAFIIILFCLKPRRHIEDEQKRQSIAAAAMQTFTTPHAKVSNNRYNNRLEMHPQEVPLKPPPAEIYKMVNSKDSGKKSSRRRTKSPIAATKYSIADLQTATKSFSDENLIGEGSFGTVYKAELPEKVVAVKKMEASVSILLKEEDIRELVSNISSLHHPNLTQLVGYCMEHGHCLLVYDYFGRGTLHDVLHSTDETRKELTWNTRVKIALGTARALEYLHEVCLPSMIHKDFKSANILLDEELNPHLSDSGIAAFLQCPERQVSTQETGSFSYSVPEYAMSGAYTTKSDVYGFGVVMLELLTGREPFDSKKPRNEKSLVRWATPQLHDIDALTSMVDPALMGLYPVKSLSRFADIISLCVQPEPEFRPLMSEVVQSLVRLMQRASLNKRRLGDDLKSSDTQDTSDIKSWSYSHNAS